MNNLQKPITKEKYNKLDPYSQGYICYMQAAWNKNISDENPYKEEEKAYYDWKDGNFQAMLDCQDSEE